MDLSIKCYKLSLNCKLWPREIIWQKSDSKTTSKEITRGCKKTVMYTSFCFSGGMPYVDEVKFLKFGLQSISRVKWCFHQRQLNAWQSIQRLLDTSNSREANLGRRKVSSSTPLDAPVFTGKKSRKFFMTKSRWLFLKRSVVFAQESANYMASC